MNSHSASHLSFCGESRTVGPDSPHRNTHLYTNLRRLTWHVGLQSLCLKRLLSPHHWLSGRRGSVLETFVQVLPQSLVLLRSRRCYALKFSLILSTTSSTISLYSWLPFSPSRCPRGPRLLPTYTGGSSSDVSNLRLIGATICLDGKIAGPFVRVSSQNRSQSVHIIGPFPNRLLTLCK